jgi:hypothetical protein
MALKSRCRLSLSPASLLVRLYAWLPCLPVAGAHVTPLGGGRRLVVTVTADHMARAGGVQGGFSDSFSSVPMALALLDAALWSMQTNSPNCARLMATVWPVGGFGRESRSNTVTHRCRHSLRTRPPPNFAWSPGGMSGRMAVRFPGWAWSLGEEQDVEQPSLSNKGRLVRNKAFFLLSFEQETRIQVACLTSCMFGQATWLPVVF